MSYQDGALGKLPGKLARELRNLWEDLVAAGATVDANGKIIGLPSGGSSGGLPGLLAPFDPRLISAAGGTGLTNRILAVRVVVPKTGVLHDISVYIGATSGNMIAGVYDTGDALAGSRTLLWSSASTAVGSANNWQVVGDPALSVTAGQQLDLAIMADNVTVTFGRALFANGNQAQLPANFIPATGGASPKMQWANNAVSFAMPSAITEANCSISLTGQAPMIIGRVV